MTLYAIVGARPRRSLGKGVSGKALHVVEAGGAAVVIERAPAASATPEAIRAHDRVVRRIAAASPSVLPFRFGSAVRDGAALTAALAPVASAIGRALALVEQCVQFTIRVYGEASPPPRPARSAGPGARWLGARMAARRAPEIDAVTEATAMFVRAAKTVRHDRAPLVASVYHLVPKASVRRYRAALASSSADLAQVKVETSGPWPAYAFAELL